MKGKQVWDCSLHSPQFLQVRPSFVIDTQLAAQKLRYSAPHCHEWRGKAPAFAFSAFQRSVQSPAGTSPVSHI
jgi:hypothetical protein